VKSTLSLFEAFDEKEKKGIEGRNMNEEQQGEYIFSLLRPITCSWNLKELAYLGKIHDGYQNGNSNPFHLLKQTKLFGEEWSLNENGKSKIKMEKKLSVL